MTGRDLRRLRRSIGVTQHELSVFSALFQANIYQLEAGRRKITPKLELRLRAAIAAIRSEVEAAPRITHPAALDLMEEMLQMRENGRAAARRAAIINVLLRRFIGGRNEGEKQTEEG
jgi:transcriptional regulator with XRE-family HTH domain